jgi:predicted dehydrogenase
VVQGRWKFGLGDRSFARRPLKLAFDYSQRVNPKHALVREKILDGKLGEPVSALISRNITRSLGKESAD